MSQRHDADRKGDAALLKTPGNKRGLLNRRHNNVVLLSLKGVREQIIRLLIDDIFRWNVICHDLLLLRSKIVKEINLSAKKIKITFYFVSKLLRGFVWYVLNLYLQLNYLHFSPFRNTTLYLNRNLLICAVLLSLIIHKKCSNLILKAFVSILGEFEYQKFIKIYWFTIFASICCLFVTT